MCMFVHAGVCISVNALTFGLYILLPQTGCQCTSNYKQFVRCFKTLFTTISLAEALTNVGEGFHLAGLY